MSGSQIGAVVGYAIGFYFGGPVGGQFGAAIGGYVGGVIDPTILKGPSIGDAQQQTSLGGQPIPKFFGHCPPVAVTLIDGDKLARKFTKTTDVGKGATTKQKEEGFIATRAFLVGEGPALPARITRNGKLVYSTQPGDSLDADSGVFASQMTWYEGNETQGPDPSLEALHGVGNTPYYRGRCYFVVRDDDETQTRGAANQYRVEVISSGTQTNTCNDPDALFWYPLDDVARNGVAREVIAGKDGVYSDTDGVEPGPALRAGSSGSLRMTHKEDGMHAVYPSDGVLTVVGRPEWTVRCYFNLEDEDPADGGSVLRNIASFWQSEQFGYLDHGFYLRGTNNLIPNAAYSDGATDGHFLQAAAPLSSGHLLHTMASDGTWTLYINGNYETSAVISSGYLPGRNGGTVVIGSYQYPSSTGFIGCVSDFAGWSRCFTPDEVYADYLSLTAYFPLPDIAGAYVNRDGVIYGICTTHVAADTVQWKDIAMEIARRANPILLDHLEVDNMTDEVPGFILGNASLTGTDYMRSLCTWYFVNLPEYDDALRAIRLGGSVVATLDEEDLLVVEDEDDDVREQAIAAYQRVTVMYPDPANNYVPTPQTAPRTSPDVTANSNITIECPIPFDATTMSQKTDIIQKIAFLQVEGTIKRAFPAEYSRYVASDAILFNSRRYLITKASNDDCMVRFEATYDRPSAYTSLAAGSVAPAPEPQSSNLKGPTIFHAMNLPRLRTQDNSPGMYIAAQGLDPVFSWPGADIYLSVNDGESFQLVTEITDTATIGELASDTDADGNDSTGLIEVKLLQGGELSSITLEQMNARQNGFVLLTDDVPEIGQFQTATEDASIDRLYELTNVLRGQMGTDAEPHFTGDRFVLLDGAIQFLPISADYIGRTLIFRAVTKGTAIALNPTISVVFEPLFTGPETVDFLETNAGVRITTNAGDYLQVTHA